MECESSCKSCMLSDVKDRLWILYSRTAWVYRVTSATSLNAVESKACDEDQGIYRLTVGVPPPLFYLLHVMDERRGMGPKV